MYEEQERMVEEEEEEKEEVATELRTTTKNIKRYHRTLFLKKKDEIVNTFPILSQKNADITVIAENNFNEIRRIYIYKKKVIEDNQLLKQQLNDLELMEFRYRNDVAWLQKKERKYIF